MPIDDITNLSPTIEINHQDSEIPEKTNQYLIHYGNIKLNLLLDNLKELRHSISEKIIKEAKGCQESCRDINIMVEDINDYIQTKSKR